MQRLTNSSVKPVGVFRGEFLTNASLDEFDPLDTEF